jgi:multiple sugar transport system permease protein
LSRTDRRELLWGLLFISPWIVGFLAFVVYPMVNAGYLSFTRFSGFGDARWIGLRNYRRLLQDDLFWTSLWNTAIYVAMAVPLGLVVALGLALAMNQRLREVRFYRTAFYLPSILPLFALSLIFVWLLNPRFGLFNHLFSLVGLPPVNWLGDPRIAKISLVLVAQLGAGHAAVIFLAGLRAIPQTLYDAAIIDGANDLQKLVHVTIPLLTPSILYNLISAIGVNLQIFTQAYIMTDGGPVDSTLFYALYLYRNAFNYSELGYASAMSWILFVLNLALALFVFWRARRWVRYEVVG